MKHRELKALWYIIHISAYGKDQQLGKDLIENAISTDYRRQVTLDPTSCQTAYNRILSELATIERRLAPPRQLTLEDAMKRQLDLATARLPPD